MDEFLELADEVLTRAELELRVDSLLEGSEARLLEAADLVPREGLVGEILERGPAPERERRTQLLGALGGRAPVCFRSQPLEARQVEPLGIYAEDVTGGL